MFSFKKSFTKTEGAICGGYGFFILGIVSVIVFGLSITISMEGLIHAVLYLLLWAMLGVILGVRYPNILGRIFYPLTFFGIGSDNS